MERVSLHLDNGTIGETKQSIISFSTSNCNESLSSISNEDHSKLYKERFITLQSILPMNLETGSK